MRISNLKPKIALALQSLVLVLGISGASLALAGTARAEQGDCDPNTLSLTSGAACAQANDAKNNLFGTNGVFITIMNTLIFLIGAVAVVFLIIGGFRYVVSQGDAKHIAAAKDTILYALVGIGVAVISFAAVQFVVNSLGKAQ